MTKIGLAFVAAILIIAATPTPQPVATARPASSAERMRFRSFAPAVGVLHGRRDPWIMDESAVAGSYAIVGFANFNSGVTYLLHEHRGVWTKVNGGGGQITYETIMAWVPTINPQTARSLAALAIAQDR